MLGLRLVNVSWLICSDASVNGAISLELLCALHGLFIGSTMLANRRRGGGTVVGR